ncbi:RHODANESE-LIKE DOMAIN-CONTAINING PROTEIN 9 CHLOROPLASTIC [Salix viminalis]|uniref:RHODANESE-LIKE DOMAIN-CONTAINING PROTEIN 9 CHLOROPLASTIC n=1 Tax=Salix viminalis TaxID=40686 RepID=A0A9Q0V4M5_SALVM|nr:RHODANESE-LIKE DOMAIN-CONTAINING PROTEIN 9 CHLOROPLASTIC [Salix viminalis]
MKYHVAATHCLSQISCGHASKSTDSQSCQDRNTDRERELEIIKEQQNCKWLGIATCALTLSSRSNFTTSWLEFETRHRRTIRGEPKRWRNFGIRAEVDFVNSDEAKKLVTDEGYVVLDVRDRTQYERAHIKSCYHVPLFIENQDNDFGTIIKRTSQLSPKSKLLIVCQGGLRSTAAANKLEAAGFRNVACVTSGLQSVKTRFYGAARCWQSWFDHNSRKDLSSTWNCTYLCVSVHHLLPRSSRKAVSTSPVGLVLVIIPSFLQV